MLDIIKSFSQNLQEPEFVTVNIRNQQNLKGSQLYHGFNTNERNKPNVASGRTGPRSTDTQPVKTTRSRWILVVILIAAAIATTVVVLVLRDDGGKQHLYFVHFKIEKILSRNNLQFVILWSSNRRMYF